MSKIKQTKVTVYKDAVVVRGENNQVVVKQQKHDDKKKFIANHVIHLKSLTKEAGHNPGVRTEISQNGKVKFTHIGLSDKAIVELYIALGHYIKEVQPINQ